MFVWYPKEKVIHDENNVLTDDELVIVRDLNEAKKGAENTSNSSNHAADATTSAINSDTDAVA